MRSSSWTLTLISRRPPSEHADAHANHLGRLVEFPCHSEPSALVGSVKSQDNFGKTSDNPTGHQFELGLYVALHYSRCWRHMSSADLSSWNQSNCKRRVDSRWLYSSRRLEENRQRLSECLYRRRQTCGAKSMSTRLPQEDLLLKCGEVLTSSRVRPNVEFAKTTMFRGVDHYF